MGVAAIILAAGMSTRMGSNKLLERMNEETLLGRVLSKVEASRADPIFVILGYQAIKVDRLLPRTRYGTVFNGSFRDGMSTSIRAGIRTLPDDCTGTLIVLGDMPSISPDVLNRMIDIFDASGVNAICVPTFRGVRGNPVLFGRGYFSELLSLEGDVGARSIITANADCVLEVEADDNGPLIDIDTPEELAQFRSRPS
jgi:molybdenum cofactor cytidylyltransferase